MTIKTPLATASAPVRYTAFGPSQVRDQYLTRALADLCETLS